MTRRITAVVLALIFGASPLAGALHAGGEHHHWCAAHETVEEGASPVTADRASLSQAGHTRGRGHHACAFTATASLRFVASSHVDLVAAVAAAVTAAPSPPAPVGGPIALLDLAPKSGPPHASI